MLFVPPRSAVEAAVQKGRTALVMVESPTNPRMQVCRKGYRRGPGVGCQRTSCLASSAILSSPVYHRAT